eukprot:11299954-Ditylum_brightwellii.AAC.1
MNHLNYTVDYKNTVFEKPELTHIHGEPTMANLLTLRNELRANAQVVSTTLWRRKTWAPWSSHDTTGLYPHSKYNSVHPTTTTPPHSSTKWNSISNNP